jgi:hypothetical protein
MRRASFHKNKWHAMEIAGYCAGFLGQVFCIFSSEASFLSMASPHAPVAICALVLYCPRTMLATAATGITERMPASPRWLLSFFSFFNLAMLLATVLQVPLRWLIFLTVIGLAQPANTSKQPISDKKRYIMLISELMWIQYIMLSVKRKLGEALFF